MWRTIVGMVGKASEQEQRALINECWSKLDQIMDESFDHLPKDQRWEQLAKMGGKAADAMLEMSHHLTQLRVKMMSGHDLTRAEVGVLRSWQQELSIAYQGVREAAGKHRSETERLRLMRCGGAQ